MLTKLLVANRGEIAVRVLRACAEQGIESVAVHTAPDAGAMHVRLADEAVPVADYLDRDALLDAALRFGADAVHPGYGFLAEDAAFARAVGAAGLVFVGPPAEAVAAMGDKVVARELASAAGVPVLPAVTTSDPEAVRALGAEHGWPVLIKAAHGGGGRGMRLARGQAEVGTALTAATAEARSAFGDGTVYAERYLAGPRHVEVQVLADAHGTVAVLGDRDCSVQRRHQKLVEEAPAPDLADGMRAAMAAAACRLAGAVGYRGAGTVEFLVEGDSFYFLEMNTRIQVEHPVTELVFGVDLVHEQLRIAAGARLGPLPSLPRGHAVECRIVAEDPSNGFLPVAGQVRELTVPWAPGIRFDTGYEPGDTVPPQYDGLIAKLVAWGPSRSAALHRARTALAAVVVTGVPTTAPAAAAVLAHPGFTSGPVTTGWFEDVVAPTLAEEPEPAGAAREAGGAWIAGRFHRVPQQPRPGVEPGRLRDPAPQRGARSGPGRGRAAPRTAGTGDGRLISSAMQGVVSGIEVAVGERVTAGRIVARVEAMKLENPVHAATEGVVEAVCVRLGQAVAAGEILLVLAAATVDGTAS
ncbi:biotin carboxylase N-terminal domain-containing protein [Pseudonocardia nematodicida]|uniref:Biotin carboxylase N-terminal domain-containing protein n=1 Tax=Pseudonocardia nematodicida TaxID=1206997 RepID=A0ABV1KFK6_9PSEU